MAKCKFCGKEMETADGCGVSKVYINGQPYKRIPYGNPKDTDGLPYAKKGQRCPECGALPHYPHHWKCLLERCPKCGGYMASCSCRDVRIFSQPFR